MNGIEQITITPGSDRSGDFVAVQVKMSAETGYRIAQKINGSFADDAFAVTGEEGFIDFTMNEADCDLDWNLATGMSQLGMRMAGNKSLWATPGIIIEELTA